jgi:hypothetical protein
MRQVRRKVLFLLRVNFLYNDGRLYGFTGPYSLYGGILTTDYTRKSPLTCRYSVYYLYRGALTASYIRYRGAGLLLRLYLDGYKGITVLKSRKL